MAAADPMGPAAGKGPARDPGTAPARPVDELPAGYRQGIVTAISIFISFSLVFLRYWGFEAPGDWTSASAAAAGLMVLAILLQVFTLWRSLQIKDSLVVEYNRTLRWFMASVCLILFSVLFAAIAYSGVFAR